MEKLSDSNFKKILIDFSEYERLKHIENEYIQLQHSKESASTYRKDDDRHYNQIGKGDEPSTSSVITPPFASAESGLKQFTPIHFDVKLVKNDLNTSFDEEKLLALVPKSHLKTAKYFLKEFDKRGDEITWNSSGVIFINQVAIPNSNIYLLFPLLFKKTNSKLPGFHEFVQKLHDMGLSDLITVKSFNKNYEPNNIIVGQGNLHNLKEEPKNVPWWYLGD